MAKKDDAAAVAKSLARFLARLCNKADKSNYPRSADAECQYKEARRLIARAKSLEAR